ncbi:MAG: phosphoadenosine phosphosulfate reductase family protein [Actinomycetota bacterium]|nr:phosphoadenosine phosphosulfate reductase family protein [Actinomycetota bacterium]
MTQRDLFYEEPDLASYDVILVNSSGGKDSTAPLDYVAQKARRAGVLRRTVVIHADLGAMEWPGTPELVEGHASHYGVRFIKVRRDGPDLLGRVEERGMWPDAARRWCTSKHKTQPILKATTALVEEINVKRLLPFTKPLKRLGLRRVRVLNVMGMRVEESPARAKKPPLSRDERASNGKRVVENWLPLHDWSEAEVWNRLARSGLREHPAYALGMSRAKLHLLRAGVQARPREGRPAEARARGRVRARRGGDSARLQARVAHARDRPPGRERTLARRSRRRPMVNEPGSGGRPPRLRQLCPVGSARTPPLAVTGAVDFRIASVS